MIMIIIIIIIINDNSNSNDRNHAEDRAVGAEGGVLDTEQPGARVARAVRRPAPPAPLAESPSSPRSTGVLAGSVAGVLAGSVASVACVAGVAATVAGVAGVFSVAAVGVGMGMGIAGVLAVGVAVARGRRVRERVEALAGLVAAEAAGHLRAEVWRAHAEAQRAVAVVLLHAEGGEWEAVEVLRCRPKPDGREPRVGLVAGHPQAALLLQLDSADKAAVPVHPAHVDGADRRGVLPLQQRRQGTVAEVLPDVRGLPDVAQGLVAGVVLLAPPPGVDQMPDSPLEEAQVRDVLLQGDHEQVGHEDEALGRKEPEVLEYIILLVL